MGEKSRPTIQLVVGELFITLMSEILCKHL